MEFTFSNPNIFTQKGALKRCQKPWGLLVSRKTPSGAEESASEHTHIRKCNFAFCWWSMIVSFHTSILRTTADRYFSTSPILSLLTLSGTGAHTLIASLRRRDEDTFYALAAWGEHNMVSYHKYCCNGCRCSVLARRFSHSKSMSSERMRQCANVFIWYFASTRAQYSHASWLRGLVASFLSLCVDLCSLRLRDIGEPERPYSSQTLAILHTHLLATQGGMEASNPVCACRVGIHICCDV